MKQAPEQTDITAHRAPGMSPARSSIHGIREFTRFDPRPRDTKISTSTPLKIAPTESWEKTAVDITRLEKSDPRQRQQINNAWRALKAEPKDNGARLIDTFKDLRRHFPDAGIEVPEETLNGGNKA